jgi:hypothetical protein
MAVVVGYQIGYLANLLPVPGGIGVLDGGLLGALVLYKLPLAPTAAAVVLYHTIALWLPTLGGTLGFILLRRSFALPALAPKAASPDGATAGSRLEDAGQHQRADHDQHAGGERVSPAVEPS